MPEPPPLELYVGVLIPFGFLLISLKRESRRQDLALLWGFIAAIIAYYSNWGIIQLIAFIHELDKHEIRFIVAPVAEELIKAIPLFFLMARKEKYLIYHIPGYAMAMGIGFSIFENFYYVQNIIDEQMPLEILYIFVRSISTSLMHGTATSMIATAIVFFKRSKAFSLFLFIGMIFSAMMIHSFFNIAVSLQYVNIFGLAFPWLVFFFQYSFLQLFKVQRINRNFFNKPE